MKQKVSGPIEAHGNFFTMSINAAISFQLSGTMHMYHIAKVIPQGRQVYNVTCPDQKLPASGMGQAAILNSGEKLGLFNKYIVFQELCVT